MSNCCQIIVAVLTRYLLVLTKSPTGKFGQDFLLSPNPSNMFKQAQTIPDPSYPPLYSKMSRQNRFKVYRFKFSRPNRKPTEILHKPHRNPTATPTEPQLTPTKSCFFPFQHFTLPCKHCKSFLAQVGQLKLVSWWLNTSSSIFALPLKNTSC